MTSETLLNKDDKLLNSENQMSQIKNKCYLNELKDWFVSEYPDAVFHEATFTESAYIYIDDLKIRFSDHIQNNMSNKDLYIIKTKDKTDTFIILMQHSRQPYTMDYNELRLFIKHYLMIIDAEKNVQISKDISTAIKEKIKIKEDEDKKKAKAAKTMPLAVDSIKPSNLKTLKSDLYKDTKLPTFSLDRFNETNYTNANFKALESQYLIKDLPWYGKLQVEDIRRSYMCTIVSRCATGGLSYKETLQFIGSAKTNNELYEIKNKAQESFISYSQRICMFGKKYPTPLSRYENWEAFNKDLYEIYPWMSTLSKTNKDIIMYYFKKDVSIYMITGAINKIYKEFGNMKWSACIAFKAEMKERIEIYNENHKDDLI